MDDSMDRRTFLRMQLLSMAKSEIIARQSSHPTILRQDGLFVLGFRPKDDPALAST